jgi:hypothetical protein
LDWLDDDDDDEAAIAAKKITALQIIKGYSKGRMNIEATIDNNTNTQNCILIRTSFSNRHYHYYYYSLIDLYQQV